MCLPETLFTLACFSFRICRSRRIPRAEFPRPSETDPAGAASQGSIGAVNTRRSTLAAVTVVRERFVAE